MIGHFKGRLSMLALLLAALPASAIAADRVKVDLFRGQGFVPQPLITPNYDNLSGTGSAADRLLAVRRLVTFGTHADGTANMANIAAPIPGTTLPSSWPDLHVGSSWRLPAMAGVDMLCESSINPLITPNACQNKIQGAFLYTTLLLPAAGTYSFKCGQTGNDGALLDISPVQGTDYRNLGYGRPVMASCSAVDPGRLGKFITTEANTLVNVRVAWNNWGNDAVIDLHWTPPGGVSVLIPAENQYDPSDLATYLTAADDDFRATPIAWGAGGTTPTIFGNDFIDVKTPFFTSADNSVSVVAGNLTVNPDGTLSVPTGLAPGDHEIEYEICRNDLKMLASQRPCATATATVRIAPPPIDAVDDVLTATPATLVSAATTGSVFAGDSLNGAPVNASVVTPSLTDAAFSAWAIAPDGTLTVPAGVAPGTYGVPYRICWVSDANLCDDAVARVTVTAPAATPIAAADDVFAVTPDTPGSAATTPSVFGNDFFDGALANSGTVGVLLLGGDLPGASIDAQGVITVPAGTPPGPYTVNYEICRQDITTVCAQAQVTITVAGAAIDAVDDSAPGPFGSTSGGELDLLGNDRAGSGPAQGAVSLTIAGALPAGVTLVDGKLVIGTTAPVGTHQVTYQICRNDAPTVCDTATATFEVVAAPLAEDDEMVALAGQPMFVPVLGNDPDRDDLLAGSLQLDAGSSGGVAAPDGKRVTFAGVGVWRVDDDTAQLVFEPEPGFVGTPPTIRYSYRNAANVSSNLATVTPVLHAPGGGVPSAADDNLTVLPGAEIRVPVLSNDPEGSSARPGSVQLLATAGATLSADGKTLIFPGKGNWKVDDGSGELVFTPEAGFTDLPPVVRYTYLDGNDVRSNAAQVVVTRASLPPPQAKDDTVQPQPAGPDAVQTPSVFGNDTLDGVPVNADSVIVSLVSSSLPGASIDKQGVITLPAGTPADTYTFSYRICRKDASALCSEASMTVTLGGGAVTPIPTLGYLGLGMLAALVGVLGLRQRRRVRT